MTTSRRIRESSLGHAICASQISWSQVAAIARRLRPAQERLEDDAQTPVRSLWGDILNVRADTCWSFLEGGHVDKRLFLAVSVNAAKSQGAVSVSLLHEGKLAVASTCERR